MKSARGASAYSHVDDPFQFSFVDPGVYAGDDNRSGTEAWASLVDELLRIRCLKDDWDGEGTDAPEPALVDWAISLAQYLQSREFAPADRVIASVNGTVYFEWFTPLEYREIEVLAPGRAGVRSVPMFNGVPSHHS